MRVQNAGAADFDKRERDMSFLTVVVCLIAGIGAGVGTGFAGLSAAAFIGPLLIGLVGIPAYQATAIGLASDVLASAVSAWTYHRAGNIDRENVGSLLALVLAGTAAGSLAAQYIPNGTLGLLSIAGSLFLGCQQLLQAVRRQEKSASLPLPETPKWRRAERIVCGLWIGFVCGFMGTGGGMMMLLVLTIVMGDDLKTAVGTSVVIMTFTALFGSGLHFYLKGLPDGRILALCALTTLAAAGISACVANRMSPLAAKAVVGILLTAMGAAMIVFRCLGLG